MALGTPHTESPRRTRPARVRNSPRAPSGGGPTTAPRRRLREIDVLKGLAIIGVMVQHAFTSRWLYDSWDTLWAGQAVPVFFVLMGLNATQSMDRRPAASLRELYTARYFRGRFRRLVVPILLIWPVAIVVALIAGEFHIGPTILVGVLPIASSPGNYFITIVLEFAVVFPAVYWCFRRAPGLTTAAVVVADVGFELLARHVHALGPYGPAHGYIYEASILKYGCAIVAGMWMSRVALDRRKFTILTVLAAMSFAYLVWLHQAPADFTSWLVGSFSISTNFLSVFYAVWLTYAGLLVLRPRPQWPQAVYGSLEWTGRASYHVFLVQILWFGAIGAGGVPMAILGILVCCVLGTMFYGRTEVARSRRSRRAPVRRAGTARRSARTPTHA